MNTESKLRAYQVGNVETLLNSLERWGVGLDTSEMGTGKTYMLSAAMKETGFRPYVITPKATIPAWHRVAEYFGLPDPVIINYDKARSERHGLGKWQKQGKGKRWIWDLPKDAIVAFDELHNCKGYPPTLNAKLLLATRAQGIPVLGASGTIASEPKHLYAIGHVAGLHDKTDFEGWLQRLGYFRGKYQLEWNCGFKWFELWKMVKGEKFPIEENQLELTQRRQEIMKGIADVLKKRGVMVRLEKKDIPGFPPAEELTETIDIGPEYTKRLNKVMAEYRLQMDELEKLRDPREKQAATTRARMEVEILKVPALAERMKNAVENGQSPVVFLNFRGSLFELAKLCPWAGVIVGDQPDDERQQVIDDFADDKIRGVIASLGAGGTGINLHDFKNGDYPRVAYVAPSFWAEIVKQARERIWRDGALTLATIVSLFAAGTVEEDAQEAYESKSERINALNDAGLDDANPEALRIQRAPESELPPAIDTSFLEVEAPDMTGASQMELL